MTVALETLSIKVLADLYNLLAETPVKKFADKAAGAKRLTKLLEEKNHEVFEVDGEYDVRPIATQETGPSVTPEASEDLQSREVMLNNIPSTPAEKPKKEKKTEAKGGKRGPAPEFSDSMVISVLVANPKRPNTASYDRFALYTDGLTVGAFLAAGGRRADLAWDSEKNFIKIEAAK